MTSQDWAKRGQAVTMNCFNRGDKVMVEGKGSFVKDADGKEYLDFLSGIAVNVLGHSPDRLVEAITDQAQKLIHVSNYYWNPPAIELAEKLTEVSGLDKVFFANSGAEANEGMIKLARKWGRETKGPEATEIISLKDSFHGRTLATLMATGQEAFHQDFQPNIEGFVYAQLNDLESVKSQLSDKTCAIILEVIQGEGGVNPADPDFIKGLEKIRQEENILILVDEIQTGIGRTGKMFGYQHYDLKPDIISMAKGLGGGFPIGAIAATDAVASHFNPGDHGTTFGGNPLATAAGIATIDAIEDLDLVKNAEEMGQYLVEKAEDLMEQTDKITQLKGKGLLFGMVVTDPAAEVSEALFEEGLLVSTAKGNVIRLLPALNVSQEEIDLAFEKLASVLV